MERVRRILDKLIFPGAGWSWLIVLSGGGALALTFGTPLGSTYFAYAAYLLSAYALTVGAANLAVRVLPLAARLPERIPLLRHYLDDDYFRVRMGLLFSFLINLCYAGLKLVGAALYASVWEWALAVYYVMLSAVRLYLLRRVPASRAGADYRRELLDHRTTGRFLLVLSLALSGIAVQIVRDGQGYSYPGMLIYAAAAYTFYCFGMSVYNTVKYRKFHSPVLSAAKAVNLTTAIVSLFSLETAMLAQFGGDDLRFQSMMTAGTAACVCVCAFIQPAVMLVRTKRRLRAAACGAAPSNKGGA